MIDEMIEMWRQRQDLHRSEKGLTLRIKGKCRRFCDGDKTEAKKLYKAIMGKGEHDYALHAAALCMPFIESRALLENQRKTTEKMLSKAAKELPVWKNWGENVKGIGAMSVAGIVGEAGDLSRFPTVAKFWKRMGLAVIGNERQQKKTGVGALEHGYSPSRRSVVWTIGDSMLKSKGIYREVYDVRKLYEVEKAEKRGLIILPELQIPKKEKEKYMSLGHIHNRAKRYAEKKMLKDMWLNW